MNGPRDDAADDRGRNTHVDSPRNGPAPHGDATLARVHRMVLMVLAASAALVGAWAQVAPYSFYTDFPGLRRFWVSLDGPFNEHLIRDVGGLNLALALLTAAAAVHGRARLARLAAACWLIFSGPHFAYHATHLGPFGGVDATAQVVSLALQLAVPLWVLLTTRTLHNALAEPLRPTLMAPLCVKTPRDR